MWASNKLHHSQTYVDSVVLSTYSCDRLLWTNTAVADYCGQIQLWQTTLDNTVVTDNCGQIQLWQTTVDKYSCGRLLWTIQL
jgi:hypothetical protein